MPGLTAFDLAEVTIRLASRSGTRTEADIQSDVRLVLLYGDLSLEDEDIEVLLEAPAGEGKRIDVEAGCAVIEVKKDLRQAHTKSQASEQLAGYLRLRTNQEGQRYAGILTDGVDWYLYTLDPDEKPVEVSRFHLTPTEPDVDGMKLWLEGVLATRQHIAPTPKEISRRLGASTSSFALDQASLAAIYQSLRRVPELQVKRMLWARLLTTAFGDHFADDDDLFIEHTYLVIVAGLIAHVIVGLDVRNPNVSAADLLSGRYFQQAEIGGVVEADFFDWPLLHSDGQMFVQALARRVARFDWSGVEHDVLKVLYESVVSAEKRHSLGEYYTPDWLAELMVADAVLEPLTQRVLDPSCGSGTFVFHAVRHLLAAADAAGVANADAVQQAVGSVYGVDVHPVAVTLARVTYLLAIGLDRLQDRRPFSVPISIGDSLQWSRDETMLADGGLVVHTTDGAELFASELRWPASLAVDAGKFDRLVSDLCDRATQRERGARLLPITRVLNAHGVSAADRPTVEATYKVLCRLHDEGRDHIWGYYVRNLARPYWLSRPANRPDVILGNPPWLSYRYMTEAMKERFRADSQVRGLWAGAAIATSQDLSGYFVARAVQLYLKIGGHFAFVMPNAALTRPHFEGFRLGDWPSHTEATWAAFDTPWDVRLVKPFVFPMPASVVRGRRSGSPHAMPADAAEWSGRLPGPDIGWAEAESHLQCTVRPVARPQGSQSPYRSVFRQGASIVPRSLVTVETLPAGPLGIPQGRQRVRSLKSNQDKKPWNALPTREGVVEKDFVRPLYLGASLAPFRCLPPLQCCLPVVNEAVVDASALDDFPGMSDWWREADRIWLQNSKAGQPPLTDWVDYQGKLTAQLPSARCRVIYNRSGTRLVAALLKDEAAIIDTKLYWGAVESLREGHYLCAIFNSDLLTELLNPIQSRGHFGPRDFYSLPFEFPIPTFDPEDNLHGRLADLGQSSTAVADGVELAAVSGFQEARQKVRKSLTEAGLLAAASDLVRDLLLA